MCVYMRCECSRMLYYLYDFLYNKIFEIQIYRSQFHFLLLNIMENHLKTFSLVGGFKTYFQSELIKGSISDTLKYFNIYKYIWFLWRPLYPSKLNFNSNLDYQRLNNFKHMVFSCLLQKYAPICNYRYRTMQPPLLSNDTTDLRVLNWTRVISWQY